MNSRPSIRQLEQLKTVMTQMLVEANNANWQELSRLDSERRVILNYSENAADLKVRRMAAPAVSSSLGPLALAGSSYRHSSRDAATVPHDTGDAQPQDRPSDEYRSLSQQIMTLDAAIQTTVEDARSSLLKQSRGMRAQASAKKCYETTRNIKASSYS